MLMAGVKGCPEKATSPLLTHTHPSPAPTPEAARLAVFHVFLERYSSDFSSSRYLRPRKKENISNSRVEEAREGDMVGRPIMPFLECRSLGLLESRPGWPATLLLQNWNLTAQREGPLTSVHVVLAQVAPA